MERNFHIVSCTYSIKTVSKVGITGQILINGWMMTPHSIKLVLINSGRDIRQVIRQKKHSSGGPVYNNWWFGSRNNGHRIMWGDQWTRLSWILCGLPVTLGFLLISLVKCGKYVLLAQQPWWVCNLLCLLRVCLVHLHLKPFGAYCDDWSLIKLG